jgi:hypothetical protein
MATPREPSGTNAGSFYFPATCFTQRMLTIYALKVIGDAVICTNQTHNGCGDLNSAPQIGLFQRVTGQFVVLEYTFPRVQTAPCMLKKALPARKYSSSPEGVYFQAARNARRHVREGFSSKEMDILTCGPGFSSKEKGS